MNPDHEVTEALEILLKGPSIIPADKFKSFGKLFAFNNGERDHFEGLRQLLAGYIEQTAPQHPLCIGVFGPPGSGKSFSVKQLVALAVAEANQDRKPAEQLSMPLQTFNLTQIQSTAELAQLLGLAADIGGNAVPVLFFDEFDAPLDGAALGWLSWFLAPMHDGHFQLRGTKIPLRRAVYVFAGGTSSSFRAFGGRSDAAFKLAKGPDFVSRLRGILDVSGPNERSARPLRRAIILAGALKDRCDALAIPPTSLTMDGELVAAFLKAGRFRHGGRSLGAVVEMCQVLRLTSGYEPLRLASLPLPHLLESHVDRGPLDPREIGGGIGLSAGAEKDRQDPYEVTWRKMAVALWEQGATLVYGGHAEKGGLTDLLITALKSLPSGFLHKGAGADLDLPYLRWVVLANDSGVPEEIRQYVRIDPVPPLLLPDRDDLKARLAAATSDPQIRDWLVKALRLHRLRCRMNDQCVARVVIGGKTSGYSGRLPGILEEVLLALHARRPVYVLGGFGGAAAAVGEILGLGVSREPLPLKGPEILSGFLKAEARDALQAISDLFQDGRDPRLPVTFGEAVDFLARHAFGSPLWADNGLSETENRQLFESTQEEEIFELLLLGLERAMP